MYEHWSSSNAETELPLSKVSAKSNQMLPKGQTKNDWKLSIAGVGRGEL